MIRHALPGMTLLRFVVPCCLGGTHSMESLNLGSWHGSDSRQVCMRGTRPCTHGRDCISTMCTIRQSEFPDCAWPHPHAAVCKLHGSPAFGPPLCVYCCSPFHQPTQSPARPCTWPLRKRGTMCGNSSSTPGCTPHSHRRPAAASCCFLRCAPARSSPPGQGRGERRARSLRARCARMQAAGPQSRLGSGFRVVAAALTGLAGCVLPKAILKAQAGSCWT